MVFRADTEMARLSTNSVQVSIGYQPVAAQELRYRLARVDTSQTLTSFSKEVVAATKPLPDGKAIVNVRVSASAISTVYEADVLLPFSFVRIFITGNGASCSRDTASYKVNTPKWFVCAFYMVEGATLYKYNAMHKDSSGTWPWDWKATIKFDGDDMNIERTQNEPHFTWHIPLGKSNTKIDVTQFITQGEGFSPKTTVFQLRPCIWTSASKVVHDPKEGATSYAENQPTDRPVHCGGNLLGSGYPQKWCDLAINRLTDRNYKRLHSSNTVADSGNCWANFAMYGCRVQIIGKNSEGRDCTITGDDLYDTYQEITQPTLNGPCR